MNAVLAPKPEFALHDIWINHFSGRIFEIIQVRPAEPIQDPSAPNIIHVVTDGFPYLIRECELRAPYKHKTPHTDAWVDLYGSWAGFTGEWGNVETPLDLTNLIGHRDPVTARFIPV